MSVIKSENSDNSEEIRNVRRRRRTININENDIADGVDVTGGYVVFKERRQT